MRHLLVAVAILAGAAPAWAQTEAERATTREDLRVLLEREGSRNGIDVVFRQVAANEWNFSGVMTTGLKFSESLEIVMSITPNRTIAFRVYPHYKGGYLNVAKTRDPAGLMRHLLRMNHSNFMFWGVDGEGDAFAGYTMTLESGFPYEAIVIVLRSIRNLDQFVGDLRPFLDGGTPPGRAR